MTDSSSEVVEPSAPTQTDSTAKPQVSDSSSSASSTETKPAETLLDRVKATIQKPKDAAPASSAPGDSASAADPAKSTASDDGSKEFTTEEMAALAPRTQARMRKLTSDLNAQGKELNALRPRAEEYDKIESFVRQNGLQAQDVRSIAEIAAMLVHNPQGARERLQPIMAELDRLLGNVLPTDLQQRVAQGYLTEEDAQALSRAKASAQLATHRANALAESQQRNDTVSRQRQAVDNSLTAMDSWEKTAAKNDPDWHQKQPEVIEQIELAIGNKSRDLGHPWFPNPQEAVELLTKALETVNTRFKRHAPKPTAISPPVTQGASPRSTPAPKNTMDIIRASLNR